MSPNPRPVLLAIVEVGGYPNFTPLYESLGYEVRMFNNMRKALAELRRRPPSVVVTEFNFQSDFRDRTSSLESMLAVLQRTPETRVIVFYEKEYAPRFEQLHARFPGIEAMAFPIGEDALAKALSLTGED